MTEAHLRQTGGTVSAKPIVLRAEYAFCSNLTIIDTPGFILKVALCHHRSVTMHAMSEWHLNSQDTCDCSEWQRCTG